MSALFSVNGNEAEIRKALGVLIEPGAVFEVRAPKSAKISGSWKTGTVSGYFDNIDSCIAELGKIESAEAVYVTLNPVNPALLARRKNRLDYSKGGDTTSDHDVTERRWLLIDCDPQRPQGISASNPEKERATAKAREVYTFLVRERGWPKPVACDSGNGNHLLFPIALPAGDGGLVKRVLEGLNHRFGGDGVKIDCSVFNPARITKLYGTPAMKGDSTPERPHRLSKVLVNGGGGAVVTREQLEALANELALPAPEQPVSVASNGLFDMEDFLSKHGIGIRTKRTLQDGRTIWILDRCPRNHDHTGTSVAVLQTPGGVNQFKCQHDSCQNVTWSQMRAEIDTEYALRKAEWENQSRNGKAQSAQKQTQAVKMIPAPMVQPRPLADLLDAITGILKRYVVFPLAEQPEVIALWTLHTWVLEAFDYTPYLHVFSAETSSGKSRLLEVLKLLVNKPWKIESGSTSSFFRKVEKVRPTLLHDEIDNVFNGNAKDDAAKELQAFFNSGFERDGMFTRCVGQNSNIDIGEFSTFCPKALAGIDKVLSDTLSNRCLPIELERQSRNAMAARFRKREASVEVEKLRAELEAWSKQPGVINALRDARPALPGELSDRQWDICEPLLAIADMAAWKWPENARRIVVTICGKNKPVVSIGVQLLAAIRQVFDRGETDRIASRDLLEALVTIEDGPWAFMFEDALKHDRLQTAASKLAKKLNKYKTPDGEPIRPRLIKMSGGNVGRGYLRDDFLSAWDKYLPAPTPTHQKAVTSVTSVTYEGKNGNASEALPKGQPLPDLAGEVTEVTEVTPSRGMRDQPAVSVDSVVTEPVPPEGVTIKDAQPGSSDPLIQDAMRLFNAVEVTEHAATG